MIRGKEMKEETRKLLELIKSQVDLEERDPHRLRWNFDQLYLSYPSTGPMKMRKEPDAPAPAYWIVTPDSSQEKVMLFFHGGLFSMGSPSHQYVQLSQITGDPYSAWTTSPRSTPSPGPWRMVSTPWLVEEGSRIYVHRYISREPAVSPGPEGRMKTQAVVALSPLLDLSFPVVYQHRRM